MDRSDFESAGRFEPPRVTLTSWLGVGARASFYSSRTVGLGPGGSGRGAGATGCLLGGPLLGCRPPAATILGASGIKPLAVRHRRVLSASVRGQSQLVADGSSERMSVNGTEALKALRAWWWSPVVGALLGAALATVVSLSSTPLYESHLRLFVSTSNSTTTAEAFQGSQFSQQRVTSYAELLTSVELAGRVVHDLGLAMGPAQLADRIQATPVPDTVLIDVTV